MKTIVIVPAYNEAPVIAIVLEGLKRELLKIGDFEIVVVDDGSTDRTFEIAKRSGATTLKHPINRGLGGTLGTGFAYAKREKADLVVTFDGDGQHDPNDIHNLIGPIQRREADVVIGSRTMRGWGQIPLDRRPVVYLSNLVTKMLFGISTTDSQSGFRAFSKQAVKKISIKTQEMEVSSELFAEINRLNLKLVEVPVRVHYTRYSREKGQTNLNAFSVLLRLLLRLGR
jgi:glycosyltransferase involved in cell wall biosynthesis